MNATSALLLLAGLALPAADTRLSLEAQGSILAATGDLKKMADSTRGLSFGAALHLKPAPEYGLRLHLNLNAIKGPEGTGLDNSTPRLSGGLDATRAVGRTTFFLGLLGVRWGQDQDKATLKNYTDWYRTSPTSTPTNVNNSGKGTKLGFRVGVEVDVTRNLATSLVFTQSEFNKVYQPSWVNVGLRYRFNLN